MSITTPNKLTLPFAANAESSYINNIPVASQISTNPNGASYSDGFPPATMKAPNQGGLNPYGQDVNGVLKAITSVCRFYNAGGSFTYDSVFANDPNVGGYPLGATVLRADGAGFWFNEVAGNTTNPDGASASGWYPGPTVGVTTVALSNSNVTLTYAQAGKDVLILSGALTANVNVILPAFVGMRWVVHNNTTGSFSATVKTASGSGVAVPTGYSMDLYCDGNSNIQSAITSVTTATKLATPRTVQLIGDVTGSTSFDGSNNVSIITSVGVVGTKNIYSNQTAASLTATAPKDSIIHIAIREGTGSGYRFSVGHIPASLILNAGSGELFIDYGDAPDWIVSFSLNSSTATTINFTINNIGRGSLYQLDYAR